MEEEKTKLGVGCRKVFLYVAVVLIAVSITAVVVIAASVLYTRFNKKDHLVKEGSPESYDVTVEELRQPDGADHAHAQVYIDDIMQDHIIKIAHPFYDIFVLKKYKEGREMILITTKPENWRTREIIECQESNLSETQFVPTNFTLAQQNLSGISVVKSLTKAARPLKLNYRSCDQIPREYITSTDETINDTAHQLLRFRRQAGALQAAGSRSPEAAHSAAYTYGNWGGKWRTHIFSPCCWGCDFYHRCSAFNCTPPLDPLDRALMDFTFCYRCWRDTPTPDLPHCDCLKDLMADVARVRCPPQNYRACRLYRSDLKGIMTSHRCWGRLVTKMFEIYHCGYKQQCTRRQKGGCEAKPEYCVRGRTIVRNNFKCENYLTCEESARKFGAS